MPEPACQPEPENVTRLAVLPCGIASPLVISEHGDGDDSEIAFIDDLDGDAVEADLYLWISGDTMVAAPEIAALRAALDDGAAGAFATTPFGRRVTEAYEEGAGVVIAADIASFSAEVMAGDESEEGQEALEATGLATN